MIFDNVNHLGDLPEKSSSQPQSKLINEARSYKLHRFGIGRRSLTEVADIESFYPKLNGILRTKVRLIQIH